MDNQAVLDHPEVVADVLEEHPNAMVSDAGQDRGGLVPLSAVMARLLVKLDALRVR